MQVSASQQQGLQQLQAWIIAQLAQHAGLPPQAIDPRQPFARYGIDSLKAVRMTGQLEEHLGRTIPPTLLFDYPNVTALSRYLVLGEMRNPVTGAPRPAPDEPIAVVGIGCRFPGGKSVGEFWKLLETGGDAIGPIPVERWGMTLQRDSDQATRCRRPIECGGFLEQIDQFDAALFGINAREAEEMDPQQRLLLHVAWEALEHAGLSVDALAGNATGVFVGVSGNEYAHLQSTCQHGPNIYRATGNSLAVIANRLSFLFDWQGPSMAVDTACSSSLVAVHQAVTSLRRGECNLALAGGVSLIVSPDATASLSQAGMLSSTGRCRTFSSEADGFVRGEGCGVVLLKRLSDAERDGDRIVCVVRGSSVNQDGRSNGLTAPNGLSQQGVLRGALRDAQLEPGDIDYIEAHGTGTPLGDPIEMRALGSVYGADRAAGFPLRVGSVKTNIGHLEGAAGIAGLIKVCLALEGEALPEHLHFGKPSVHIDWSWPLRIPTSCEPWPSGDRPRRAGVSSFGFGGTNAHVIVEEAPRAVLGGEDEGETSEDTIGLLLLSAQTPRALSAQACQYAGVLGGMSLGDVCYTAAVGRAHFPCRLAWVGEDAEAASELLLRYGEGVAEVPGVWEGEAARECGVGLVFGGQGSVVVGAGRFLYARSRTFRRLFDEVLREACEVWPEDLRAVLWEDDSRWQQVGIQPALYCLQVSVARLWQHYGLQPSSVLGHSLGEYAAACVAGVFSLSDGLRLVAGRARLFESLPHAGGMLVVWAGESQVRSLLRGWEAALDVAAVNSARQTVVAGSRESLREWQSLLAHEGVRCQELGTTHAFHSPLVDPLRAAFGELASQIDYALPQLPYVSSMLGRPAGREVAQASYWEQHLRSSVQFHAAAEQMLDQGPRAVLEVGAGSVVTGLLRSNFRDRELRLLGGLSGRESEWSEHLGQLGQLYVLGVPLQWQRVWSGGGRKLALPTYPFETQRYWFTPSRLPAAGESGALAHRLAHPLLGQRLELAGREIVYETRLASGTYLDDHRIGGRVLFPASGYLELAMAAGQESGIKLLDVCDLKIRRPLQVGGEAGIEPVRVQVVLSPEASGFACRVLSWQAGQWQLHARCELRAETPPLRDDGAWLRQYTAREASDQAWSAAEHYGQCRQLGLEYGASFQGLQQLYRGEGEAWGRVQLPAGVSHHGYLVHPALLDACLQVTAGALPATHNAAWLPVQVKHYRVARPLEAETTVYVKAEVHPKRDERRLSVAIDAADSAGQPVFEIEGLTLRRVDNLHARRSSIPTPAGSTKRVEPAEESGNIWSGDGTPSPQKVLRLLRQRVAEILESPVGDVPIDRPLDTLGLDSLMAFELREEVKQSMGVELSLEVFLQDITMSDLSVMLTQRLERRIGREGARSSTESRSSSQTEDGLIEGAI